MVQEYPGAAVHQHQKAFITEPSEIDLSVSIHLPILRYLSIHPSVYLSIYRSVYVSTYL